MGIYDREYYRREGPSFLGSFADRGRVCKWLIGINILLFLVQMATARRIPVFGMVEGPVTQALDLNPDAVMHGEVWRLITHAFLHSVQDPWHILINMIVLWWAGSDLEQRYGAKEFLALYLTAAVVSGAIYTVTMLGGPPAVGASGAIMALLVIFACFYPNRIILLFFVLPVPVWLLVVLFVGHDFYVFATQQQTGVAVAGHLGGALFGFLYHKWHWHLTSIFSGFRSLPRRRARRPQLRIYREDEQAPTPVAVSAPSETDEHLEAELDAVLEKMSLVGKDNLTESEKQILLRASEIYRRRRS
jgi:rhomboid family protein